jgi:prepilin-type N-terminal cleavage/methylation domain-containing protein
MQTLKRECSNTGFTLIELSAVVFVLALIILIGVPLVRSYTDLNLRTDAMRVSSSLRYAFNLSSFRSDILYRIRIDFKEGRWYVEHLDLKRTNKETTEYIQDSSSSGRGLVLSSGVRFKEVVINGETVSPEVTDTAFVNFFPYGYVPPIVIYLENRTEDVYTITINSFTGITKVFDREVKPEDIYERTEVR